MTNPRLSMPPPSKGKPVMLVLLLLGIAGAAGLVTWLVVNNEPDPPPAPPAPPPRPPTADLIVEPPPEPLLTKADAGVDGGPDAGDADVEPEKVTKRRGNGTRRYGKGTIDGRRVAAFIRSKQAQVRRCYERRLKVNNMLQGLLQTQITILPNGRVSNVNFTQDTLYDGEVRSCVARVIKTWQFPEPDGGAVTVSTPFRFAPRL